MTHCLTFSPIPVFFFFFKHCNIVTNLFLNLFFSSLDTSTQSSWIFYIIIFQIQKLKCKFDATFILRFISHDYCEFSGAKFPRRFWQTPESAPLGFSAPSSSSFSSAVSLSLSLFRLNADFSPATCQLFHAVSCRPAIAAYRKWKEKVLGRLSKC